MSEIVEKCIVVRHAAAGASKNSLAVGMSAVILAAAWLLVPSHVPSAQAVIQALEIIAPRAGLTTTNRYYKAYPGLEYRVPIAVIGGHYPNTYALTSGPSGMSVDSSTGILTWSNPTTSGSPHSVTVQVTDALGATATVTWTITVTTSGFIFVQAGAADGGNGLLASPFNSIDDWYVNKANAAYSGQFIYYRSGTYNTAAAPIEDGWRLAMPSHKPTVWLAYPGDSPVINVAGSHISPYPSISNWFMGGLVVRNMTTDFGVRIDSGGDDMVFYGCTFDDMPVGAGGVGTNASGVMISNGGAKSNYVAFIGNTFSDFIGGSAYGILGYYADKVLVQGNTFSNMTDSSTKAIGPKMNNEYWFIRDNRINLGGLGDGIWIDTYPTTGNIEASYNLSVSNGNAFWLGQETGGYGDVESYRNTYVGSVVVDNLTAGTTSFEADVVVNSSGSVDHIDRSGAGGTLTRTNVLSGIAATGILDSGGNLQGSFLSYLGTRGYQRTSGDTTPPAAPTGLEVQ